MVHLLKIDVIYYNLKLQGLKPYEIRFNDRSYKRGDYLILNVYDSEFGFTDKFIIEYVDYVFTDEKFCKDGYVILTTRRCRLDA